MFFIQKKVVPADRWRDVTYGRVVVDYRTENTNPYQTRLTVGGDRVNYSRDFSKPTVDLTTVKIILNIIVSTLNAKFTTIDVKDFYLSIPMDQSDYMRLKLRDPPESLVQNYNIEEKAN